MAVMNPYPCDYHGYHGDVEKSSICLPAFLSRYQKRISGPLLDRSHIHVEVQREHYKL
jgi:magnesium chelatase family protein